MDYGVTSEDVDYDETAAAAAASAQQHQSGTGVASTTNASTTFQPPPDDRVDDDDEDSLGDDDDRDREDEEGYSAEEHHDDAHEDPSPRSGHGNEPPAEQPAIREEPASERRSSSKRRRNSGDQSTGPGAEVDRGQSCWAGSATATTARKGLLAMSMPGNPQQVDTAIAKLLDMLRRDKPQSRGIFVLLIPEVTSFAFLDGRGQRLRALESDFHCEVTIAKAPIEGMMVRPVIIKGSDEATAAVISKLRNTIDRVIGVHHHLPLRHRDRRLRSRVDLEKLLCRGYQDWKKIPRDQDSGSPVMLVVDRRYSAFVIGYNLKKADQFPPNPKLAPNRNEVMVLRGTMAEKSRGMVKTMEVLDVKEDKSVQWQCSGEGMDGLGVGSGKSNLLVFLFTSFDGLSGEISYDPDGEDECLSIQYTELLIQASKTRNVIGRGGDTINWICKTTGCNVQVQKSESSDMPTRFVTFEGSLDKRVKAALMVLVAIELSFMPATPSSPEEGAGRGQEEVGRRDQHPGDRDREYSPESKRARHHHHHQQEYQSHGRSTESPRGHRGSHSYEGVSESSSAFRQRGSLDNAAVALGTAADRLGSDIDHDEASYFSVVVGRNTINSWVKAGFLDELSRRSGAHVEIGKDVPQTMDRQLLLSGTILQNSLACLYIQAKLLSG
ncbi:Insulin-like growth factor 2 mRNA-binding protein 3 [Perkinsus olseni]|uniref:Insulin-like growth factor 2 mRNA-binding protein 3 n=1 Tax=Perkinsus olseni TaxID=32597 RepID=A0A7J6N3M0_PEROL|nr:Insulin-like growth factor 2 mRNA-binding protein 3 [Perkinsus olseni]